MIITLWLSLCDGTKSTGFLWSGDELWTRTVESGAVPLVGPGDDDGIVLWSSDEGPGGGPMWSARRRYMDVAGGWHVELSRMVLDPTDKVREAAMRYRPGEPVAYRAWETAVDGDPRDGLVRGGWKRY